MSCSEDVATKRPSMGLFMVSRSAFMARRDYPECRIMFDLESLHAHLNLDRSIDRLEGHEIKIDGLCEARYTMGEIWHICLEIFHI